MATLDKSWRSLFSVIVVAQLLTGCVAAPTTPMPSISYKSNDNARQRNLLVMLRGLGADNNIFAEEGIIDEIRNRHLPFDVIAPDSHYGYFKSKTFEIRLKEDIIDPARRQGYEHIWLSGFSMGGLGCLFYLRSYPDDIDGVLLTSPFLGWSSIHKDIRLAGSVADWSMKAEDAQEWESTIWDWIKHYDPANSPPIWLGYGEDDILASDGPPLLATVFPSHRVFSVPGNHTVATFKKIFLRHLDTLSTQY